MIDVFWRNAARQLSRLLPDVFEEVQTQRVPLLGLFSSEGARNVEGRDTFF